jgi:transposase
MARYADHVPLRHQGVIYLREGVELERSLLASRVGAHPVNRVDEFLPWNCIKVL